jgi:hypothetical protein
MDILQFSIHMFISHSGANRIGIVNEGMQPTYKTMDVPPFSGGAFPALRLDFRRGKPSGVLPRLVSGCRFADGKVLRQQWLMLTPARSAGMQGAAFKDRKRIAGQVCPDKNVNCRYTTAAFTWTPESVGFVMLC